jgi:hypothetical protein
LDRLSRKLVKPVQIQFSNLKRRKGFETVSRSVLLVYRRRSRAPPAPAATATGVAGDVAGSRNSLKTLLTATGDRHVLAGTGLHRVAEDGMQDDAMDRPIVPTKASEKDVNFLPRKDQSATRWIESGGRAFKQGWVTNGRGEKSGGAQMLFRARLNLTDKEAVFEKNQAV